MGSWRNLGKMDTELVGIYFYHFLEVDTRVEADTFIKFVLL